MTPEHTTPPRWATRFLSWYCKPALLEDLEGDLNEYFERNCKTKGKLKAKWIYVLDVIKFMRPYTLRTPKIINLFFHWIMISSYIKTSGRSILRNKLFSSINIFGLAISMAVGLLLIAMLSDIYSYDRFHEKRDRIYRVNSLYQYMDQKDQDPFATTSLKAAQLIKETFTNVEDVAIVQRDFSADIGYGEKKIPLSGFWANESFFNVFSFQLLQGNPGNALKEPYSIVLTEESARKLFGGEDAIGKVVVHQEKEYKITGVMADVPDFSHFKFDMLASISTLPVLDPKFNENLKWDNIWNTYAYVLLPEGTVPQDLATSFNKLSQVEDKTVEHVHIELTLQPLLEIVSGEDLNNQIGRVMGKEMIWILSALVFVVILSACFNYTNLSVARSLKRSREVGIRKTIGALKSHVIFQFITESIIISLLALILSFGIFLLVRPHFIGLEDNLQHLLSLNLSIPLVLLFILFAAVIGLFAGIFPALFFGNLNAIAVMKNLSAKPVFKGLTVRKVLIVFQYCISIIAITATLILHKQYKHFVAYDLGFTTHNILNIRLQGNKAELLMKDLEELPEVKEMSRSMLVSGVGNYWGATMKYPKNPLDSAGVYYNQVDAEYIPLHNHQIIAGSNFTNTVVDSIETEVIVNQGVLKRFNIANQDPEKAIGEVLKVNGKEVRIVGVMKDFAYGKANDERVKEIMMREGGKDMQYLNVKILSDNWPSTYAKIEKIWKNHDTVHPLDAKFYDDEIEQAFSGLKASVKVGGFLAFLVICISSIGLLGMVIFTTETRIKEISIRKVLGANEGKLLFLLSKGFVILLTIAAAIALPLTYIVFSEVLLTNIANHAPLTWSELLTGVVAVLAVALIMIASQTLKVARTNPAEVLKAE